MRKTIAMSVLLSLMSIFMLPVQAAMLNTQQLVEKQSMDSERVTLSAMMQRADVQAQMIEMGVTPADVQQRMAALTDAEVAQLDHQMGQIPAGADALGILLLLFIVFIVTYAVGATDIFDFVDPI